MNKEENKEDKDERKKNLEKILKMSKLDRFFSKIGMHMFIYASALFHPTPRDIIFNRQKITGLLENSFFSNSLYVPNLEGSGVNFEEAIAGRWVSFDLKKHQIYPNTPPLKKGGLYSCPISEIIENDKNDFTPDYLLDPYDLAHVYSFNKPSFSELKEQGLIEEKTYREVYEKAGLKSYIRALEFHGVADDKLYAVTPKGNTLVFIEPDDGDSIEYRDSKESRLALKFA